VAIFATVPVTEGAHPGYSKKAREDWKKRYEQAQRATPSKPKAPAAQPAKARIKDRLPKRRQPETMAQQLAEVRDDRGAARIRRRRRDETDAIAILARFL
jgi:hypothetical protein